VNAMRHGLLDRMSDPVWGTAASRPGVLLTCSDLHLAQLRSRRAVLLDGGALDGLAYTPDAGPALERILRGSAGQRVAVYAHGGVIRMALSILLDLPLRKFEHFEIDYASATWLDIGEIKAGRPRTEIQLLNFTPWRDA